METTTPRPPVIATPQELIAYAIKRLAKAQEYGPDMPTSKELCISDAIRLMQTARALLNGEL